MNNPWKNITFEADSEKSQEDCWRAYDLSSKKIKRINIKQFASNWRFTTTKFIAEPGSSKFKSLVRYSDLIEDKYEKDIRIYKISALLSLVLLIVGGLNLYQGDAGSYKIFAIFSLGAIFMCSNYFLMGNFQGYIERAEYCSVAYSSFVKKNIVVIILLFLTVILHYITKFDLQQAFQKFSNYPHKVYHGEIWRIITGPLIHNGLKHTIANYSLLLLLFPLLVTLSWRLAFVVLGLSSILSHAAYTLVHFLGWITSDVAVGISGSNLGIIGALLVLSVTRQKLVPVNFWVYPAFLSLISLFLNLYLNPNSSFIIHLAGFLVGVLLSFAFLKIKK